jgi:hypothetical protein
LALAQSLAKVASWILLVKDDMLPDAACAMASRRSLLGVRVARILEEEDSRPRSVVPARLGAAAALLGTVAAAPLVAPPGASVDGRAALPPAVEANTFSDADPTEAQAEAARETAGARTPSSSNPPLDTAVPRFPASAPTTTDSLAPNTAAPRSATAPGPTPPPAVVAATLAEVGASLDAALAELDGEVALLRETAARKVLSQALAARLDQLERRASELRARAKRIRDLLVAAHPGGMEVPRGGRERAASPSAAPRVR